MSKRFKTQVYCHKLLQETAEAMAQEVYQTLARNNLWFKAHPNQKAWVRKHWGNFIAAARATLAEMLARPIDEDQKTLISEALIADNPLHTHRTLNTRMPWQ